MKHLSLLSAMLSLVLAVCLGFVVWTLADQPIGLENVVADKMNLSGVTNPVTAVLLNFRGYDTLLEMVVLILALLGIWSFGGLPFAHTKRSPSLVLDTLIRLLLPVLLLVAIYLLWVGAYAPGGAFQAGSVLASAGVLLLLSGWHIRQTLARRVLRATLAAGVLVFVAVAIFTLVIGQQLLQYPLKHAGTLIFIIEAIGCVSIGVTLTVLFWGRNPVEEEF